MTADAPQPTPPPSATYEDLLAENVALKAQILVLMKRLEALEKQLGLGDPPSTPPFVKANVPPRPKNKRKKRDLHFCRRRETPTHRVDHKPDNCPDCGRVLSGGSEHRKRQVIDIPFTPVTVTEHTVFQRYCGVCKRKVVPKLDLSGQVLGKRRIGLNLTAWIAALHIDARIPVRTIQRLLSSLYKVHISAGEIIDLLDATARKAQSTVAALLEEVRGSPYIHADETGWRENGQSGYLWSVSTPEARVYRYDKSRSGDAAEKLLGSDFDKVLVTDFYCAYNRFACLHQRCWPHFARDLHKLRDGADARLNAWIDAVLDVYERAKAYQARCRDGGRYKDVGVFDRRRRRKQFERELYALAETFLDDADAPQKTLSNRIAMFLSELFTFVEYPDVPSDNNAAERSIRPAVIARKVRGGTRSAKGSETWQTLMSLFATWRIRNLDPIALCTEMIRK